MRSKLSQISIYLKNTRTIEGYFKNLIFANLKNYPIEMAEDTQQILTRNTIDIHFDSISGFEMCIDTSCGIIHTSFRSLEIIHALAYAHFLIYEEIKATGISNVNIDPELNENVKRAEILVMWARDSSYPRSCEDPLNSPYYPDNLHKFFKDDKELKFADDLWGLVISGIIYHEIAHKINNDICSVTAEMQRKREFKADEWMYERILNGITFESNEEQFILRTMGITSSLGILAAFDVSKEASGISTHPNIAERLLAFFNKYVPESDPAKPSELAYIMAIATLQTHFPFAEQKKMLLKDSYADFREYLQHVSEILKGSF